METVLNLSVQYTFAQLARLDIWLRREVLRLRQQINSQDDAEFRGLYISNEEVDRLLSGETGVQEFMAPLRLGEAETSALEQAMQSVDQRIAGLEQRALAAGQALRLNRLAELFGLSEWERLALLICLAPEVDLKYERLYAYLQDDVTKKRPTVDLVMRLLCATVEARLVVRSVFTPGAPLLEWNLVTLHDDPGARRPLLTARYLKLDDRIAGYLLGSDQMDARLLPLARTIADSSRVELTGNARGRLERWASAWDASWQHQPPVILFHGRYGSGRHTAASCLAGLLGQPILMLDLPVPVADDNRPAEVVRLAEREALLNGGLVCLDGVDALLHGDPSDGLEAERAVFYRALARARAPVILLAKKAWEPVQELRARPFLQMEFTDPTYHERRAIWAANLDGSEAGFHARAGDLDPGLLAGRFRLTAGQIRDAAFRARGLLWARDPAGQRLESGDIDAACRGQSQHRLGTLARKLAPRYTWEDIVLPRSQMAALRLICTTMRQRPTVYGDWGFDRKLSLGKGVICLFAGPTGTGKTMSAEIIANDLGLDLYKIDLSAVVSKYIGETEKNLERIFSEAQDTDAILFFDEADALFGKRSEVKDAHDRYANIETAYLLQRTEEYNGLVILASNIKKNMDEAFIRRIHFLLEFPFPEEAERLQIWQRTFPAQAPRGADIDLPFLARKLKLAGGNIRNIILTAAFLAAEDRVPIGMRHLVRGASYEFQKMGKMVVAGDFEQYFDLVRA